MVIYYKSVEGNLYMYICIRKDDFIMKKIINKDNINVVVHGGCFHADDVACVALLKIMHKEVNVSRKFKVDPESENADFVLDIGRMDKVTEDQVFLDHHQGVELIDGTEVKHCAFSKLVDLMIDPNEKLFKKHLFNMLVLPVAAQDNGQNGSELGLFPSPLTFVNAMGLSWKDDQRLSDQRFAEVVEMAVVVIKNIIKTIKDKIEAINGVNHALNRAEGGVMTLSRFLPWTDTVVEYNDGFPKIKLVVFPNNRGGVTLQVVPKKIGSFESWLKIPEGIIDFEGCTGQAHGAFAFFDHMDDAIAAGRKLIVSI